MAENRLEKAPAPTLGLGLLSDHPGEAVTGRRAVRWLELPAVEEIPERERLLQRYLRRPDTVSALVKHLPPPAAEWVGDWEPAQPRGVGPAPRLWLRAPILDHARLQRDQKLEAEREEARDRRRQELAAEFGASNAGRFSRDAEVDPRWHEYFEACQRADAEVEREYAEKQMLSVLPIFRHFSSPHGGVSLWRDASTGVLLDGDTVSVFVDVALTAEEMPAALERLTGARSWDREARLVLLGEFEPDCGQRAALEAAGVRYVEREGRFELWAGAPARDLVADP